MTDKKQDIKLYRCFSGDTVLCEGCMASMPHEKEDYCDDIVGEDCVNCQKIAKCQPCDEDGKQVDPINRKKSCYTCKFNLFCGSCQQLSKWEPIQQANRLIIEKGIIIIMQDGTIINFPEGNNEEYQAWTKTKRSKKIRYIVLGKKGLIELLDDLQDDKEEVLD